jgi:hypothetical protein
MSELRCIPNGTKSNPLICVSLDDDAIERLDAAQKVYSAKTRKRVTRSVIVRRALALLAEHLNGIDTASNGDREITALLMVR